jgi:hypothetical protein
MAETMIRKQVYLEKDQDRKLKALAAQRRCTEAELIREALDRLPEPESDEILVRLEGAGLLAPELAPEANARRAQKRARGASGDREVQSVARLEAEHAAWLAARAAPLELVEALRQDRARR